MTKQEVREKIMDCCSISGAEVMGLGNGLLVRRGCICHFFHFAEKSVGIISSAEFAETGDEIITTDTSWWYKDITEIRLEESHLWIDSALKGYFALALK